MTRLSIQEAQSCLLDLIHNVTPGEEVVIKENDHPFARLTALASTTRQPRQVGSAKGQLTIVRDDDDHLRDFADYMP